MEGDCYVLDVCEVVEVLLLLCLKCILEVLEWVVGVFFYCGVLVLVFDFCVMVFGCVVLVCISMCIVLVEYCVCQDWELVWFGLIFEQVIDILCCELLVFCDYGLDNGGVCYFGLVYEGLWGLV